MSRSSLQRPTDRGNGSASEPCPPASTDASPPSEVREAFGFPRVALRTASGEWAACPFIVGTPSPGQQFGRAEIGDLVRRMVRRPSSLVSSMKTIVLQRGAHLGRSRAFLEAPSLRQRTYSNDTPAWEERPNIRNPRPWVSGVLAGGPTGPAIRYYRKVRAGHQLAI